MQLEEGKWEDSRGAAGHRFDLPPGDPTILEGPGMLQQKYIPQPVLDLKTGISI